MEEREIVLLGTKNKTSTGIVPAVFSLEATWFMLWYNSISRCGYCQYHRRRRFSASRIMRKLNKFSLLIDYEVNIW